MYGKKIIFLSTTITQLAVVENKKKMYTVKRTRCCWQRFLFPMNFNVVDVHDNMTRHHKRTTKNGF